MNSLVRQSSVPTLPAPNTVFELTLDFSAPENERIQMVCADGYSCFKKWKCAESQLTGPHTKKFMLKEIGHQSNFYAVKVELQKHGRIPEGEWREAFKKQFPSAHGRPVGVPDASWVSPVGSAYFPCVNGFCGSVFSWADGGFSENWLWLIEV